ncbi:hypothetical protein CYMTET_29620 [Cymbomonas tetramitiformis]|uniref:STAS domain-containing protein n=1 Tax=Cymbomonas tetramitiformis TaxID=36881 RepID=A0AAE0KUZ6_9CHLO|nr:hypothetical protein CYMTET_29620 [Cymbomonas tetramitiformis]
MSRQGCDVKDIEATSDSDTGLKLSERMAHEYPPQTLQPNSQIELERLEEGAVATSEATGSGLPSDDNSHFVRDHVEAADDQFDGRSHLSDDFQTQNIDDLKEFFTEENINKRFRRTDSTDFKKLLEFKTMDGDEGKERTALSRVSEWFPILDWLPTYDGKEALQGDILSGITVSVILVPQAVAYAMLADLPPEYGLYCSLVPILVYALMGTSRHLCIGPFALVSLLVADLVHNALPEAEGQAYIDAVMLLSFMTGVTQVVMGVMRMGIVVSFLAGSVISGFTTGSAILIMTSQAKHILGMGIPRGSFFMTVYNIGLNISEVNPYTVLIGVSGAVMMYYIKEANAKYCKHIPVPESLIVLLLYGIVSFAAGLDQAPFNVPVVGSVPGGFPGMSIPAMTDTSTVTRLIQPAILTASIGYMVSISVVQLYADKLKYNVNPDQEFIALGCSNVMGSLFLAYPASGSLSRTAVCANTGGRTGCHNLIQAGLVILTLMVLTPLFAPIPYSILAAVVILALKNLLAFSEGKELWSLSRHDFWIWMITFVSTVSGGVQVGLITGMTASMLWLLRQTSNPWWAHLGRLPGTRIYRNVRRYNSAEVLPGIIVMRFDAPLHFANKDFFQTVLKRLEGTYFQAQAKHGIPMASGDNLTAPHEYNIIDCSGITSIDSSAMNLLREMVTDRKKRSPPVQFILCSCKGPLRTGLRRSGLTETIGEENMFVSLHQGVSAAELRIGANTVASQLAF